MALRSYIARVELEYIVVAENMKEAQYLAAEAHRDDYIHGSDFEFGPLNHIPAIYEDIDDLVHAKEDMTVAQALKLPGGYEYEEPKNDQSSGSGESGLQQPATG